MLDCLRNRPEWAQLVDRGPKVHKDYLSCAFFFFFFFFGLAGGGYCSLLLVMSAIVVEEKVLK